MKIAEASLVDGEKFTLQNRVQLTRHVVLSVVSPTITILVSISLVPQRKRSFSH